MMQKFQALDFLKTIDVLKNQSLIKLQNLNKYLTELTFKPGDYIYKQGDEALVFYIIKRGSVLAETIIDIDEYNRYPIVSIGLCGYAHLGYQNMGDCKEDQKSHV